MSTKNNGEMANQLSLIDQILPGDLTPNSKYPKLFANAAVFVPTNKRKDQAANYDSDIAHIYDLGDISLRRFGPGLDIYDEDSLIAVWQLVRQRKLIGTQDQLSKQLSVPIYVNNEDTNAKHEIYIGEITPYQVNKYLGKDTGGSSLKKRRESIIRLGRTAFEIKNDKKNLITSPQLKFFDFVGQDEDDGAFLIFLDPQMVKLMQEYFIINIDIRRELTDLGKAVHRYLTTVPQHFEIDIVTMQEEIKHGGTLNAFVRDLRKGKGNTAAIIDKLKALDFLSEDTVIEGTGRSIPYSLKGERIWRDDSSLK